MIDPGFEDVTLTPYVTIPTVDELQGKIVGLENQLKTTTDNWEYARERLSRRENQVSSLEDFLKNNISEMDSEHVEEIAGIFGITLQRDYDVTITVTFSGTISAPLDYDMDDLENDIQAELSNAYYGNKDVDIDVSEDSMDIDWTEA